MTYDFDRLVDRRRTDSSKWQKYGPDVLPLWVADMDFQSPEPVIRALRERVEHGVFGYLAFEQPEFHELFADRLLKRYGWRVSPDAVVIIPGVIPGFNVAGRILSAPGDGLILQTPVYPPILRAANSIGLTREEAPLARRPDGRYEVDVDAFTAAIRERNRFFLLCNPHNPVGRVFTRQELTSLAQVCLRRGLAIVADEIHCELTLGGQRHTPIASLDPEIAERTITLMAPSKTFNLAGLKCSVAIIPNAALREKFVNGRIDLVQTVNVFGYTAAFAAYRDGQPWLDELLRYLEANRDFVSEYVRTRLPALDAREGARPDAQGPHGRPSSARVSWSRWLSSCQAITDRNSSIVRRPRESTWMPARAHASGSSCHRKSCVSRRRRANAASAAAPSLVRY